MEGRRRWQRGGGLDSTGGAGRGGAGAGTERARRGNRGHDAGMCAVPPVSRPGREEWQARQAACGGGCEAIGAGRHWCGAPGPRPDGRETWKQRPCEEHATVSRGGCGGATRVAVRPWGQAGLLAAATPVRESQLSVFGLGSGPGSAGSPVPPAAWRGGRRGCPCRGSRSPGPAQLPQPCRRPGRFARAGAAPQPEGSVERCALGLKGQGRHNRAVRFHLPVGFGCGGRFALPDPE